MRAAKKMSNLKIFTQKFSGNFLYFIFWGREKARFVKLIYDISKNK